MRYLTILSAIVFSATACFADSYVHYFSGTEIKSAFSELAAVDLQVQFSGEQGPVFLCSVLKWANGKKSKNEISFDRLDEKLFKSGIEVGYFEPFTGLGAKVPEESSFTTHYGLSYDYFNDSDSSFFYEWSEDRLGKWYHVRGNRVTAATEDLKEFCK